MLRTPRPIRLIRSRGSPFEESISTVQAECSSRTVTVFVMSDSVMSDSVMSVALIAIIPLRRPAHHRANNNGGQPNALAIPATAAVGAKRPERTPLLGRATTHRPGPFALASGTTKSYGCGSSVCLSRLASFPSPLFHGPSLTQQPAGTYCGRKSWLRLISQGYRGRVLPPRPFVQSRACPAGPAASPCRAPEVDGRAPPSRVPVLPLRRRAAPCRVVRDDGGWW
jgi:hypothetical protein